MRSLLMLLVFLLVGSGVIRLLGVPHASAEGLQNHELSVQKQLDGLLPPVGSALVEAGQGKLAEATKDVAEFRQLWDSASTLEPEQNADQVDTAVSSVSDALSKAEQALSGNDSDAAKKALADLARATNQYIEAFQGAEESRKAIAGRT